MRRLLAATSIMICLTAFRAAEAQTICAPCKPSANAAASGFFSWTPGSTVDVYVAASDFTPDEIEFLLAPVANWNAVSSETLTNAVAHELGHSFGLLDCYSCKDKTTVMNQFKNVNTSNHMNGPTACDVAQVKSAYRAHANHAAQKKIVVEEGAEPVDDDTPIVLRKP